MGDIGILIHLSLMGNINDSFVTIVKK